MTRTTCDFCGEGMQPQYQRIWTLDAGKHRADFCSLKCVAGWAITNISHQDIELHEDATPEQEEALRLALDALNAVEV